MMSIQMGRVAMWLQGGAIELTTSLGTHVGSFALAAIAGGV
jgi:hypothetical protein